ncbi:MAG: ATP-binding cassette domain-containing protein [Tannerellaceae bacterium]|jgi:ABC-type nitrate/sulfonate/bicarbonate transport system ATPase subunit/ABC-type nitrate/sulfonate/bicarbonate transport system permease component|nr:ATP-binding cassette domain-containing protein [Tannerellaceae bacterium]
MKKRLPALVAILFLLVVWEMIAWSVNKPEIVPSAFRLLRALGELVVSGTFYQAVGVTILRGLTGISFSLAAACGFAFLFSRYRWLYEFFRPVFVIMRSVPVVSFILLALIYLHPESIPLLIAFLIMFPLLTENLTKGLFQLRPGLKAMADTFLIKRGNRLLHIYYPQLKPFLFSGLASAMGFGWRAIIMGEALSQCSFGIGSEMKRAQIFIDAPELIAWTIIAVLIGFVFDKTISWLETIQIPFKWATKDNFQFIVSPAIVMENICFAYPDTPVLSDFTYTFREDTIYGISAPSGGGKTTLLNLINGTLIPAKGNIQIDRSRGIACVFQEAELLPHLSVLDNVMLPLTSFFTKETAIRTTDKTVTALDIASLTDKRPNELSYGQQQRVAIARALTFPSPILLLDEPFKGLDETLIQRIIAYIKERQAEKNQTIIFTTHKQEELSLLADVIIHL